MNEGMMKWFLGAMNNEDRSRRDQSRRRVGRAMLRKHFEEQSRKA